MMDLHSHIDLYENPLDVARKADQLNEFTLAVTTSPKAWLIASEKLQQFKNIKIALGIHPEIAHERCDELDLFISLLRKTNFVGEVGLDGSSHLKSFFDIQRSIFKRIIKECSLLGGRVVSVHSRQASSDVLNCLYQYPYTDKVVLHWFSGSIIDLKLAIKIGCKFSVNEAMLKSKKGREIISQLPMNLVLPETDGPFLQRRKTPIMPWNAIDVKEGLSKIWNVSEEEVEATFRKNLNEILKV